MAKKRKKNQQAAPAAAYMGQGTPAGVPYGYAPYGYPPVDVTASMQQPNMTPPNPAPNGYGYGGASNVGMGTAFNQPAMGGLNAGLGGAGTQTPDPAAAYLNAAGLDAGLLQGLPNLLRSRHTEQFLLGLVIGGAAAWVLTDEELRNKLLKTGLKLYSGLMGGLEELKEQVADVRAELDTEQHGGV